MFVSMEMTFQFFDQVMTRHRIVMMAFIIWLMTCKNHVDAKEMIQEESQTDIKGQTNVERHHDESYERMLPLNITFPEWCSGRVFDTANKTCTYNSLPSFARLRLVQEPRADHGDDLDQTQRQSLRTTNSMQESVKRVSTTTSPMHAAGFWTDEIGGCSIDSSGKVQFNHYHGYNTTELSSLKKNFTSYK